MPARSDSVHTVGSQCLGVKKALPNIRLGITGRGSSFLADCVPLQVPFAFPSLFFALIAFNRLEVLQPELNLSTTECESAAGRWLSRRVAPQEKNTRLPWELGQNRGKHALVFHLIE